MNHGNNYALNKLIIMLSDTMGMEIFSDGCWKKIIQKILLSTAVEGLNLLI